MPDPPEIPISPKRRARLDRLEALHARGFWPFAWRFAALILLPWLLLWLLLTVLLYGALGVDIYQTPCDIVWGAIEVTLFCYAFALLAWKLTPWLVRTGRNTPEFAAGQTEAWWITAAGFLLVFGACVCVGAYAGYASLRGWPISDTVMTTVVYGWIVGIVTFLWGWWRWWRARKGDPFWAKRSSVDRLSLQLAHPLLLAAMAGLTLVVISCAKPGS